MAVITEKAQQTTGAIRFTQSSVGVLAADSVLLTGFNSTATHCFLGVRMYDVNGNVIVDSTGTFTVDYLTFVTGDPDGAEDGTFEDPAVSVIDATAPATISWQAPTLGIRVTPAALTDTVTYKVFFIASSR